MPGARMRRRKKARAERDALEYSGQEGEIAKLFDDDDDNDIDEGSKATNYIDGFEWTIFTLSYDILIYIVIP